MRVRIVTCFIFPLLSYSLPLLGIGCPFRANMKYKETTEHLGAALYKKRFLYLQNEILFQITKRSANTLVKKYGHQPHFRNNVGVLGVWGIVEAAVLQNRICSLGLCIYCNFIAAETE